MGQFIRYLMVGALNTIVGYSVIFFCMLVLDWMPEVSNVFGYSLCTVLSFFLNKKYTFKSDNKAKKEFLGFVCVCLIAYIINFVVLLVSIRVLGFHSVLGQIVSGGAYVISAYVLNKYFVFK